MVRRPALILLAACAMAGPAAAQTYKSAQATPLGAPDRWDYAVFDPASHRVYVAHGDRLEVVDGEDGKVIGQVLGMPGGSHGTGIVPSASKGYTDDGKAGEVIVFDLKTLKVLKHIPAKPDADGITVDAKSGHVFVVDADSETVTVIDPKTDTVINTITVGGGLEFAVAGGDGKVYVNGAEKKELVRIDVASNTVDARWPIPGCASPHGLAFDPAGRRAFVTCVNKLMTVVNVDTGAVVASLPIGAGTDAAAFDPKRKLAFSSNGVDGTLSVIREVDPNTFTALPPVKTAVTGRTLTIDPETGRLYIPAADIDAKAPVAPGPNGRPGRPKPLPGSLKLLFLDPAQ